MFQNVIRGFMVVNLAFGLSISSAMIQEGTYGLGWLLIDVLQIAFTIFVFLPGVWDE